MKESIIKIDESRKGWNNHYISLNVVSIQIKTYLQGLKGPPQVAFFEVLLD